MEKAEKLEKFKELWRNLEETHERSKARYPARFHPGVRWGLKPEPESVIREIENELGVRFPAALVDLYTKVDEANSLGQIFTSLIDNRWEI